MIKHIHSIKEMQELALNRGGLCLSNKYINAKTKLQWECKKGHTFLKRLDQILAKQWCPYCNRKVKHNLVDMQRWAEERNGRCLSNEYINNHTNLNWECYRKHRWFANANHIINTKHWCPFCGEKRRRKHTLGEMQQLAQTNNGKCLSDSYKNVNSVLFFECNKKHKWNAMARAILSGEWCPVCQQPIGEDHCRKIMEKIFSAIFPLGKPLWLKNKKQMHLDGYNKELKTAFEYQGKHHYQINHFSSLEKLGLQRYRDKLKQQLCRANGVTLLIIPYWIKQKQMERFIRWQYTMLTGKQINPKPLIE
jgi:hypothetical protein